MTGQQIQDALEFGARFHNVQSYKLYAKTRYMRM